MKPESATVGHGGTGGPPAALQASPAEKSPRAFARQQLVGALLGLLLLAFPLLLLFQAVPVALEEQGIPRPWTYTAIAAAGGLLWLAGWGLSGFRHLSGWIRFVGYVLLSLGGIVAVISWSGQLFGHNGALASMVAILVLMLGAGFAHDRWKRARLEALPPSERPPSALAKGGVPETWGAFEVRWLPVHAQHRHFTAVWVALRGVDPNYHLWIAPRRSSQGIDVSAPLGLRRATALSNDLDVTRRFLDDATLTLLRPVATFQGSVVSVRGGIMELQLPGSLDDAALRAEARGLLESVAKRAQERLPRNPGGLSPRIDAIAPSMAAARGGILVFFGGVGGWIALMLAVVATIHGPAAGKVSAAIALTMLFGPCLSFGLASVLVAGHARWRYALPGARAGRLRRSRRRAVAVACVGAAGVVMALVLRFGPP